MLKKAAIQIMLAVAVASMSAQAQSPYPPAPGHEKLPVVFWGNYMPQIATQQLDQNGHGHGAMDLFPFMTHAEDSEEQQIRYALDAGLDGFQSCTVCPESLYNAARKVREQTGRMFYINPEWTDSIGGSSPEKAAKTMADFALAQAQNPHLFRLDGKPMYFFYNHGSWSGSPSGEFTGVGDQDSRNVPLVKELMKKQGVEALLLPSYYFFDKVLLDRKDLLFRAWPSFQPPQAGEPQWLRETAWDGLGNWMSSDIREDVAAAMHEKLKAAGGRFLYIPSVWPGYDSSNRAHQATHITSFGLRTLHDNLRMWVTKGYRQINFITWNDVTETAVLPSTRSPFGFSRLIRYYRQLAEDGTSPFDAPKTVVSYDSEVLYGDELYFQFLNLPEKNAYSSDYLCKVRLENLDGGEVATLTTRASVPDQRTDALTEARFDTTALIGKAEILSPVVSVYRLSRESNERMTVYADLRLPPITLRYNKLQFYTPYAIALDRVAPDGALSLAADGQRDGLRRAATGDLITFRAATKLDTKLRRLTLAESRRTCGTFREDDTPAALGDKNAHLFLRVRTEEDFGYRLALSGGKILERFISHYTVFEPKKIDSPVYEYKSGAPGSEGKPFKPYPRVKSQKSEWYGLRFRTGPAYRLEAPLAAKVSISLPDAEKPMVEATLAELAKGPLTIVGPEPGVAIRLELTLSGAELNRDYPLPPVGEYVRSVPVFGVGDATRYFHAWALTADDKVAYSRPSVLIRVPSATETVVAGPEEPVLAPLIRTGGIFDDFVNNYTGAPVNPFTAADVIQPFIPARMIPYYLYDFSEGSGDMLNDSGDAQQLGRAWLSNDGCTWIADGWRGPGMRLNGGKIHLRAKSGPHGAYTFSARLRLANPGAAEKAAAPDAGAPLVADGDFWQGVTAIGFGTDILPDGKVRAMRKVGNSTATVVSMEALGAGWNHVVVTLDLLTLRIYLNGKPAGEAKLTSPGYGRTHSTPTIGFSKAAKAIDPQATAQLTGDIDQIEIIGTALTPEAVAALYEKGQWMAR
jgi:hypothetical protein